MDGQVTLLCTYRDDQEYRRRYCLFSLRASQVRHDHQANLSFIGMLVVLDPHASLVIKAFDWTSPAAGELPYLGMLDHSSSII